MIETMDPAVAMGFIVFGFVVVTWIVYKCGGMNDE